MNVLLSAYACEPDKQGFDAVQQCMARRAHYAGNDPSHSGYQTTNWRHATDPPVTAVGRDRLRRYWLTVLLASCGTACQPLQKRYPFQCQY
jgi:hypothetical protein